MWALLTNLFAYFTDNLTVAHTHPSLADGLQYYDEILQLVFWCSALPIRLFADDRR